MIELLARLARPWADVYAQSSALQTTLTFLHLAGIFLGGGFAIATDRETFVAAVARASGQMRHLAHLHTIHRPVMFGIGLALGSGFLLFAADIETFARSGVFWLKMLLLALLLANGWLLSHTETTMRLTTPDSPALWARLRLISSISVGLWLALILAGTLLMTQA
jgi:hypothetical protein